MNKENRYFESTLTVETREGKSRPTIVGHAAVFNSMSEELGGFREIIEPGAFDSVLTDDVRALFNHDANYVLGRTKSNTLSLSVDELGLRYDITPPNTTYANDLIENLSLGNISQSSFGFTVDEDRWEENPDGTYVRYIMRIKRLYDVSPVTFPAYPETDVAKRELEQILEDKKKVEVPEPIDYTSKRLDKKRKLNSKLL